MQDDAGGNGHQNIVAAGLHPMITARRRAQPVAAPVIDDILPMAIFGRQAAALEELVVRACTALRAAITIFTAIVLVPAAIILMASVIGAVVGIGLKLSGDLREGGYVPFGPFLAGAGFTAMIVGPQTMLRAVGL